MLRKAQPLDLPAIHTVRQRVRENRLPHDYAAFVAAATPFVEAGHCWVWGDAGCICGDAAYDLAAAYIEVLYVDPAHERRGIGTALLDRCCRDLREAGHRAAWLHTVAGTAAAAFYRARGWVEHDAADPRNVLFRKDL